MLDLISRWSGTEIITFIVVLACALKGLITFCEWGYEKLRSVFDKNYTNQQEKKSVRTELDELKTMHTAQDEEIKKINNSIDLLLRSDRDDIKAWITEKHHYFCYEIKAIDDYSLDCIERRYSHYIDEGGNSFVADLMTDLRKLKKISTTIRRETAREVMEDINE